MTYLNGWDGPKYYAAQLAPEPVRTDWTSPAAEAGIVPPRPLQLGDILTGAFRAVRWAPATMFGVSLIVLLVAESLGTGIGYLLGQQFGESPLPFATQAVGELTTFSWSTIVGTLTSSLAGVVVGMGLYATVFRAVAAQRTAPRWALRQMASRLGAALAYEAILAAATLAVVGLAALAIGPLFAGGHRTEATGLAALLVLIGSPVYLWLSIKLMLAPCVIAVEGLGPLRAIGRSWRLSRGQFWRLLGISLLAGLLISMATGTVSSVFTFAGVLLALQSQTLAMTVIMTGSRVASLVLTLPLTISVTTLLYVDTRIRNEGFDLELSEALYG